MNGNFAAGAVTPRRPVTHSERYVLRNEGVKCPNNIEDKESHWHIRLLSSPKCYKAFKRTTKIPNTIAS